MKKALSLILAAVMVLSMFTSLQISSSALASSGSCGDNVTYQFFSSSGRLVISGTGPMYDYYSSTGDSPFKSDSAIKTIEIGSGVTKIGAKRYYYVRIRTYKAISGKNYFSAWSGTKTVKTK